MLFPKHDELGGRVDDDHDPRPRGPALQVQGALLDVVDLGDAGRDVNDVFVCAEHTRAQ